MTCAIFESPDGMRFKVEGGAGGAALYVFDEDDLEYNHLEKISVSGRQNRIDTGKEYAERYADCHRTEFILKRRK